MSRFTLAHIDTTPDFKVGDPRPDGYLARAEWADVHVKAGVKSERCNSCRLWFFQHELTPEVFTSIAHKQTGRSGKLTPVELKSRRCIKCAAKIALKKEGV